jgi:CheY-like chemotaxis protein
LERSGEELCIVVSDTGAGIDPAVLPYIFDRFSQNDSSSAHRHGGLGLGLALAKHLVELHGGAIDAASEGIGYGSTFTIKLPLAVGNGFLRMEPPALRALAAIQLPCTVTIEGVTVLAVDDQQDARAALAGFLSKCGASVTAVSSGGEALSILNEQSNVERPDVFICDIAMPGEDGYTVMKRVRKLETVRGVKMSQRMPAIALTALASREDWVRALSAGFNTHAAKPVEPLDLVMMIASLVGKRSKKRI